MTGIPDPQTPVIAFDLENGTSDLYIQGERQQFWLPVMFTHSELYMCGVIEPDIVRNMVMVEPDENLKPIDVNALEARFLENLSEMDFKERMIKEHGEKDCITTGLYVSIKNNKVEKWMLIATGPKKRRKTSVPKQWSEIGLYTGEHAQITFDVNPNDIRFKVNSSVSEWLSFDEMQLYYPKEITPEQKARLKFRYRIKTSSKGPGQRLYLEMLVLPRQLDYENLPEIKKKILDSAAAKTLKFWGQSNPVSWDGSRISAELAIVPTFGLFESQNHITDANIRRLIHDVDRQLEAGESTSKLADVFKFMEEKSCKFIYQQKTLKLPWPTDRAVMRFEEGEKSSSSGKCVKITNKSIKVNDGSKYDRPIKLSYDCAKQLKSMLPTETTIEDVFEMQSILSSSIANNTACNYKSVKRKLLSVCKERNVLKNPQFGDDALILTRLSKIKTLKKKTVKQYMKCYKTLILMEGARPPPEFPNFKQLKKGLTNKAHNPMNYVASSHRKAYSIASLRIMSHAIASTKWSKHRKQLVFTTMLLAFWGRLRLSEILGNSATQFKPDNAFLRNDLKYIESKMKKELLGLQLWIRHAKVPDPSGALVEIPPTGKFPDLCPLAAVRKYMKMRDKLTVNGETPMLLDDNGYILTKNKFAMYIQQAIHTLDPTYKDIFKDLKGHSLRSGVPTALQKLGSDVDPQIIQYLGRWRGCSVNLYLKDVAAASAARLAIANALKDSLS